MNYEGRSGAWLSGCGTLADGKLGVKALGAATFIDFQIQRLQVFGIPLSDLFYSGIERLEDFNIRSALLSFLFVIFYFFWLMRRGTHHEATWEWHFGVLWLTMENK